MDWAIAEILNVSCSFPTAFWIQTGKDPISVRGVKADGLKKNNPDRLILI